MATNCSRDLRNVLLLLAAPNWRPIGLSHPAILHPHNYSCPTLHVKRIAIADIHDGTRVDVPSIFLDIGHGVLNLGFKGRNGPYPAPLARMTYPSREKSPIVMSMTRTQPDISELMVKKLFEYYKSGADILCTDALFCQFSPTLSELFQPLHCFKYLS